MRVAVTAALLPEQPHAPGKTLPDS